ncbi:copper amine oxidase N-terminal domain-containing protein [Cohnella kolymensis]|uniref:copper amine oxidase N-terminal domain-containing protein n=1 Tax=Cohnella kolymensis TaxID=1590652 RepID=UPI00137933AC|nr:copper amine oxidase N-terminal domain-containing protein [Cohnella kolymensis]
MKRILFILISILLALSLAGTSAAAGKRQTVKVVVDGKAAILEDHPVTFKGKMYVEFRSMLNGLGYTVDFDEVTDTIRAAGDFTRLEMSVGGDVAFVNGRAVESTGQVIKLNGGTWIGLRFLAELAGYKVVWNGAASSVSLTYQGPGKEELSAVYAVFDKMLLLEAAGDYAGLAGLFAENTALDVSGIQEQWKKTRTKSSIKDKFIQSYTGAEAVVSVIDETVKLSGGFFPDNKAQTLYTLHRDADGQWKIFDIETVGVEFTNVPALFDQGVTIGESDKADIEKVLNDQLKAANDENLDSYMATLVDFPQKAEAKAAVEELFRTTEMTSSLDKWTIVAYDGAGKATLLIAVNTEVRAEGTVSRIGSVYTNEAEKAEGKWLLRPEMSGLQQETL